MSIDRPLRLVVVDVSSMNEVVIGEPGWTQRFLGWQQSGSLLVAPPHFRSEMANALLRGMRLEPLDVIGRLQQLFLSGVDLIDRGFVGLHEAVELAARHRLSVYDASYLALAVDLEGELATLDGALAAAASTEGVAVIS